MADEVDATWWGPRPKDLPPERPWPPQIREYPPDHLARSDEQSEEAFNDDWVREDFGDAFFRTLLKRHRGKLHPHRRHSALREGFNGDWWLYAMLIRCAAAAKRRDPKGEDKNRLAAWKEVTDGLSAQGVRVHLECADLTGAALRRVDLSGAHLEGARMANARLQRARLFWTHLDRAKMNRAHLEHAVLYGAHLGHAELLEAHLEHAVLFGANLGHANLREAMLGHANLREARLEHASLIYAHLEHTSLFWAHLEHAAFKESDLTGANLRFAQGLRFDNCVIRDIHIEGNAGDPWSVLRRSYSGPWFFFHLLFLLAFLAPYIGRAFALSATSDATGLIADRLPGGELPTIPAWRVLVGLHEAWWVFALAIVLFLYNVLRAVLTFQVGMLRDAEERSGRSPGLHEYMGTQGLGDESWWTCIARIASEAARCLKSRLRLARSPRAALRPNPPEAEVTEEAEVDAPSPSEALAFSRIGYWRLHRLQRVLLWIAALSFIGHAGYWAATAHVPDVTRLKSQLRDRAAGSAWPGVQPQGAPSPGE